ncbi:MAG: serpin family protein [bacterium]|nr:serpin family protein [bacterium]
MERGTQGASRHNPTPPLHIPLNTSLKDILEHLGVIDAFTPPDSRPGADFSGMTTSLELEQRLYLNDVLHQAVIKVGELGTEAAAATVITKGLKGAILPPVRPFIPYFGADHPFIYLIRDKQTGTILFLGRVTDPR